MIELNYTRSPDVVKTVTPEDNLVSVMADVPEKYNGNKDELYVDIYEKKHNVCLKADELTE